MLFRLAPDDWERVLLYNYPALTERSLRWVAVHSLHEVRHHLLDVRRQLDLLSDPRGSAHLPARVDDSS